MQSITATTTITFAPTKQANIKEKLLPVPKKEIGKRCRVLCACHNSEDTKYMIETIYQLLVFVGGRINQSHHLHYLKGHEAQSPSDQSLSKIQKGKKSFKLEQNKSKQNTFIFFY